MLTSIQPSPATDSVHDISFTAIFHIIFVHPLSERNPFFKRLKEWDHNLQVTGLDSPDSPFEEMISENLAEQAGLLRKEVTGNRLMLQQEKDELLAWIHEVKTPLTAMHLMIERMEDKSLKAPLIYEWLRVHLLLDQQLHRKRLAFMENDLYIEETDLEAVLFQEIKTLQSWCIQKGLALILSCRSLMY